MAADPETGVEVDAWLASTGFGADWTTGDHRRGCNLVLVQAVETKDSVAGARYCEV